MRCITFGLQRYCKVQTEFLNEVDRAFRIYSWTEDVYHEVRDIGRDRAGIDALLASPMPDADERARIDSFARRIVRAAHRTGDRIPFLGRAFASERQRVLLTEARDYLRDRLGIGTSTRAGLTRLLSGIWHKERRLVIVGHSLGSVIAYDTLWEMSATSPMRVALFVTIGSPLGTRFVRRFVRGAEQSGKGRYPSNIVRWTNIAARSELTALYPRLRRHYGEMLGLGLLESFEDHVDIYNHFVGERGLNVHSEYGYVIQPEFATALVRTIHPG